MAIWQVDFYRYPQGNGENLWELLICDDSGQFRYNATCPPHQANSTWITAQFQQACQQLVAEKIQIFRPQALSLITTAANNLNIAVEATRRTPQLKAWLDEKHYNYTLEKAPPLPLPDNLLGETWRFAALPARDVITEFCDRPIPILHLPEYLDPLHLGLASNQPIPGIIVYGGRQSMPLARWIQTQNPVWINYIPGNPDGLILEAGLAERWVFSTFEDEEVKNAARIYQQRQIAAKGLHFLLIQPDDSGITYTAMWLLQAEVDL